MAIKIFSFNDKIYFNLFIMITFLDVKNKRLIIILEKINYMLNLNCLF